MKLSSARNHFAQSKKLPLMALVSSGSASAGGLVSGAANFVLFKVGVLFCWA